MVDRLFKWLGGTRWTLALFALIVIAGALRLFDIYQTATFLGDQGRDAIVMREIALLKDLPALGPITSVGSIYLGPLYYYMMAPWLLLSGLNPIGPAVGIALLTTTALFFQYVVVKELTNKTTALISVFFATFSWALVEYSRFSWNPNLLPQVSLFALYTLYKLVQTQKLRYYILHGFLLSLALQLHYLALFLFPISFFVIIKQIFFTKKNKPLTFTRKIIGLKAGFFVPFAPFVVFEILHKFPNIQSILRFRSANNEISKTPFMNELFETLKATFQFSFQAPFSQPLVWLLAFGLVAFFIVALRKKWPLSYLLAGLIFLILGISFYRGPKFTHYLGGTFLLFYVCLAYLFSSVIKVNKYLGLGLLAIFAFFFLSWNVPKYYFLYEKEHQNQIDRAENIAKTIVEMKPQMPYSITSSPDAYADYPYRYFLDKMNSKPVEKEEDSYVPTKELYVVCENSCDPMSDPQWAIAHFNPQKIAVVKKVDKYPWFSVYKLTK